MDRWYRLAYLCPICGKVPGVSRQRRIDPGPDVAGTVAELSATGPLAWSLVDLMHDSVVCETTGQYVKLNDPTRLRLEP